MHPWVLQEMEALCKAEGFELTDSEFSPWGIRGMVRVDLIADREALLRRLFSLRSVHHIIEFVAEFPLAEKNPLEALQPSIQGLALNRMQDSERFRVTTNRVGKHDFGSEDVARAAGSALQDQFGTAVSLKQYDLNVRVDVYDQQVIVGYQLTRNSLSHRFEGRPYLRSVSLKATAAFVMIQLADIPEGFEGKLLDPFCGAGTILLEAGQIYPGLELWGGDVHEEPVAGAGKNLATYEIEDRVHLQQMDVRELSQHLPAAHFDYIITNPPFGLRMGKKLDLRRFYAEALQEIHTVLKPGGILVMVILKAAFFRQALNQVQGLDVLFSQKVQLGNKYMRLYRLRKKG